VVANDLYGLVLAGGKSKRMGTDKAFLSYHGVPQKDHLFALLEQLCSRVFISMGKSCDPSLYLNPIEDKFDLKGPLNGILSAFDQHLEKAWLCVAVDMPFVDHAVLQFLLDHRDRTMLATCFYDSIGKRPEPLITIWEPEAYPELVRFSRLGNISPRDFLAKSRVKMLDVPDKLYLKNVNTMEEFNLLRGKYARR